MNLVEFTEQAVDRLMEFGVPIDRAKEVVKILLDCHETEHEEAFVAGAMAGYTAGSASTFEVMLSRAESLRSAIAATRDALEAGMARGGR